MQCIRPAPTVADFIKQKKRVFDLFERKDQDWYIIDVKWWNKWSAYIEAVTSDGSLDVACDDYPGEVDNSALLCDGKLKPNLLREEDFTLVPEDVWNIFVNFYGCSHEDTSVFRRSTVEISPGRLTVEIYKPTFQFIDMRSDKKLFEGTYSESQTIGELKIVVRDFLKADKAEDIRLFIGNNMLFEELKDDSFTIGEASVEREKFLYVKRGAVNGLNVSSSRAQEDTSTSWYGSPPPYTSAVRQKPGICGLSNLGNTCFMNSAIQCMSNVPELTDYFLKDNWKRDINRYNPLGSKGRIAVAYAELVEHMWSGQYSHDVPRTLKREIAGIASQFYGYAQHDSHELLVFLMDGIHEDLNRVIEKPYIEVKDSDERPDEVVAAEAWNNYLARNDSIIVDLFHGQLKSTVICPTCNYRSVTFDPFASLNLPLPDVAKYIKVVYIWPWVCTSFDGQATGKQQSDEPAFGPIRCEIPVHSTFYVRDFMAELERQRKPYPGCQYHLAEVYNHSVSRPWHLEHQVRDRNGPPLFAYELPPGTLFSVRLHDSRLYNTSGWVGIPFYISILESSEQFLTGNQIIDAIADRIRAVGFRQPITSDDFDNLYQETGNASDAGMLAENNSPMADDRVNVSNSSPSDQPVAGSTLAGSDLSSDHLQSADMNGDVCPTRKWLRGNLFCTDDRNQNKVQLSKETKIDLRDCSGQLKLFIDCGGTTLHHEMNRLLRSISSLSSSCVYNGQKSVIKLSDCIQGFVSVEQLGARDLWYCKKCKDHKQATKHFQLWSLPNIIVVQLKRFRSTFRSRDKIDTLVEFPIRGLDLTSFLARNVSHERFVYDLIAVSNHMGSLGGGHYTAYALNDATQRWYLFDDASVREVDESCIMTRAAYVLVYRRRSTNQSNSVSNGENEAVAPGVDGLGRIPHDDGDMVDNLSDSLASGSSEQFLQLE